MLLTAGLFNLFKCFFTSNFCFDTPDLAAYDSEKNPQRNKHTKKPLANFTVLRCTTPPIVTQKHTLFVPLKKLQKPPKEEKRRRRRAHTGE